MAVPTKGGHSSQEDGTALLLREPPHGSFSQHELSLKQKTECNAEHLLQTNTALSCPLLLWLITSGICFELPQLSHCCAALSSRVKLNLETKQRDQAEQPGSHRCRASAGGPQKGAECSYRTQPASPHLKLLTLHCDGRTGQACSQPSLG